MKSVCVLGLGYVGLPISCILAKSGYKVLGVDVDEKRVEMINSGKSGMEERDLDVMLKEMIGKSLKVTADYKDAEGFRNFIVCVQTPISIKGEPDLSFMKSAIFSISEILKKGDLVIVESSIPPGTMEMVVEIIEKKSGLKIGDDVLLAYCPERLFPTNVIRDLINNEKVVAGVDDESVKRTIEIYSSFSKGKFHVVGIEVAELVKIVENTYRDVEIAFANELASVCERLGVDVKELIEIANTHPRVNVLNPGPGVGGTCVPKDPVFLSHIAKKSGANTPLIDAARRLNNGVPARIVSRIAKMLESNEKILMMGLAYKGNVNDYRDSPAETIANLLEDMGFKVVAYDPLVQNYTGNVKVTKTLDFKNHFGCVILVTDHDEFKNMDIKVLKEICKTGALVFDSRRIWDKKKIEDLRLRYFGVGTS